MKTLEPGDKLNCYVIDRNGQQSNLAIQALVVTTKQSLYADSLYSTVLCIIDERIEKLLEEHQGEEMTPFVRVDERLCRLSAHHLQSSFLGISF